MTRMLTIRPRLWRATTMLVLAACTAGSAVDTGQENPPASRPIASVEVTPPSTTLTQVGATVQLNATVKDDRGAVVSGRTVEWQTSTSAVATIDARGLARAVGSGSASLSGTVDSKVGTATLNVTIAPRPVASVEITPGAATLSQIGATVQLNATVRDDAGAVVTGRTIAWSSSNTSVATVNGSGVVTAVAAGTATLSGTVDSKVGSSTITVSVAARPVASVEVTPAASTLTQIGATVQLNASVRDDAGGVVTGRTIAWSSSNSSVVTVNGNGVVTAVAAGSATVSGTVDSRVGSSTITVTIAARPVASVEVTPATATLTQAGATVQLSATVRDDAGVVVTGRTIAWTSSTTSVATVNGNGVVTAVASGSATISGTVDSKVGNATITVTVAPRPVGSVTVTPLTATLTQIGATVQLSATVRDDAGTVVTGRPITWSSSNSSVATVSSGGLVAAVAAGTATISATSETKVGSAGITVSIAAPGSSAVLLAAGDVAGCSYAGDEVTGRMLDNMPGWPIALVGDAAYPDGAASDFANCYDPSWGRHKSRTWPAPGNHEYHQTNAGPYFDYFGAQAGETGKGYYSYTVGAWHVISLSSEVSMSPTSPQGIWLTADLAANPAKCTLAYWHRARWSSGSHGSSTTTKALWDALYTAGADVILVGHDHHYERFAPQDIAGALDLGKGMRQFVVGTGGAGFSSMSTTRPNSEVRIANTWGLLKLTLKADGYDWDFLAAPGSTATDSGSGVCH